jgi:surface antigen
MQDSGALTHSVSIKHDIRMSDMNKALMSISTLALVIATCPALAIDGSVTRASSNAVLAAQGGGGRSGGGFLSGIFGCEADGNKQVGVAVVGGALGGLLGNRIAGSGSRTLGTILGGALGAAAGSAIGCKLQKNDQAKAERAMENAVKTGQNQSWENADSGASGKVEVSQPAVAKAGLTDLKLASNVEPASAYGKLGGRFVATSAANIRSAPGLEGKIIGQLAKDQHVWVPAMVSGTPWYLISDQGIGQGYVSNALLKRETTTATANCKMVKQTVDVPGNGTASETYQACKGTDGQWAMTRV